ncbi:hypothetical protein HN018_07765 [Lichenicola cladoniae]|uniref:Uncharacterized protein n=1 Tax=Lichenicola cladoniae TaxID=1484109 RepID=A0A6M8HNH9_9PROT|nr:hypothetical protein [Lichenicola cladoniae]NPD67523.1 hypothetical protein [Acetobacteraceae bacterium]QKE89954.1 hypothetical protein HN018_07765 [Lichenicola cladoniae]
MEAAFTRLDAWSGWLYVACLMVGSWSATTLRRTIQDVIPVPLDWAIVVTLAVLTVTCFVPEPFGRRMRTLIQLTVLGCFVLLIFSARMDELGLS